MHISSRTPEGRPNQCSICGQSIHITPSLPFGDAQCPNCGSLLWFVVESGERRFFPYEESALLRERVVKAMAHVLGVDEQAVRDNPNIWSESGADSLDMVELVMELEEESYNQ